MSSDLEQEQKTRTDLDWTSHPGVPKCCVLPGTRLAGRLPNPGKRSVAILTLSRDAMQTVKHIIDKLMARPAACLRLTIDILAHRATDSEHHVDQRRRHVL